MNTQQLFRLRYRLKLTAMLVVVATVALSSAGVRGAVRDAQVGSWLPKLAKLALLPVSGFMQGPIAGQGKPGAPEQPAGADGMVSLLVKTAPGLSERAQDAALARGGATRGGRIRALRMHVVRVPQVAVDAVAKRLQSDPDIELVEIDHKRQIAAQEVPQASVRLILVTRRSGRWRGSAGTAHGHR